MPHIVDYQTVLKTLTENGLVCTYHNSGSFAPRAADAEIVGWTLGVDETVRPQMREHVRELSSLDQMLTAFSNYWTQQLHGDLWIMPASHWAFELNYGNADWLPATLTSIGIQPADLIDRNDGSAVAFAMHETQAMRTLMHELLSRSTSSDFTAAWPNPSSSHSTVAMLHHHQQIWWRTTDVALADALRQPIIISSFPQS